MESLKQLFDRCIHRPWINGPMDTQYRIDRVDGKTCLSFQGSVSKEDWRDNFSFWIVPYKNTPVKWYAHAGFVARWKAVRDIIIADLHDDKDITVLGYSQGAAIATLAFEDIQFSYPYKTVRAEVFGSPRVVSFLSGNIWARFDSLTIHNNHRDIVGMVPFSLLGYRHVSKPEYTGRRGVPSIKEHMTDQYKDRL